MINWPLANSIGDAKTLSAVAPDARAVSIAAAILDTTKQIVSLGDELPTVKDIHEIHSRRNKPLTLSNFEQVGVSNFDLCEQFHFSREGLMHTKDILAGELLKAGLPLMAKMASAGVYSNGLSLHAMPEMVLRRDLESAHTERSRELLRRLDAGEFEATEDEIDEGNARMVTSGMIVALAQKFNTPRA
jgi:hypothetical protein